MRLYLMQHGTCLSKEINPEQPLSPVGAEQVEQSAQAMRRLGLEFSAMIASPKLRAVETAAIVARAVGFPSRSIETSEAFKPMSPPEAAMAYLAEIDHRADVFVAGHLPNLNRLASRLLGQGPEIQLGFENAGLAVLEVPGKTKAATLVSLLRQQHLQRMA